MFKDTYGPWCVIAGGSDGIGAAFAEEVAARGLNVALIARRKETLAETAEKVRRAHPGIEVRTLSVDLSRRDAAETIREATKDLQVGLLIYNVGSETQCGYFLDKPLLQWQGRLQRNFVTKAELLHHFGLQMRARKHGGIVLMGSVSGYMGGAGFALYAGSKAFTHMFAEALWYEMREDNINVICTIVGPTDTPSMNNAYGKQEGHLTDPAYAASGTLDRLKDGPIWVADDITEFVDSFIKMTPRERSIAGSQFCADYVKSGGKLASVTDKAS